MTAQAGARKAITGKPERISTTVKAISFLGLVYAAFGYVNGAYLHWVDSFWVSAYSDKIAIVAFGLWRVTRERNTYTRMRVGVLTLMITTVWILFPYLTGSSFFNNHLIGTFWFFAYILFAFAFGRRVDCGWNCPCVGVRDTVGNAFRKENPKGGWFWRLRYLKYVSLAGLLGYLFLSLAMSDSPVTKTYIYLFWTIDQAVYFASFLVMPWTGNRSFCRFLCPWGAMYGIMNRLGFYKIVADRSKCIPCNICEAACDMGVPIKSLVQKQGEFSVVDCVGCGRCATECPRGALSIIDLRDYVGYILRRHLTRRGQDAKPTRVM